MRRGGPSSRGRIKWPGGGGIGPLRIHPRSSPAPHYLPGVADMPPIYQMKVSLMDSKPPVWRRIQVPADITLAKLHQILQVVMGWTDSHLHQFVVGGKIYGEPNPDYDFEVVNERSVKLSQV